MNFRTPSFSPRVLRALFASLVLLASAGCLPAPSGGTNDGQWGRWGRGPGQFQKPRAIALDAQGRIYTVDMTARIQVFDRAGTLLRSWRTPAQENGRPTGLSIDRAGNLLVADTHYYRVLTYSPEGELVRTLGGTRGSKPGEFGFVTDAVQAADGCYFVAEYGEHDRIQKFAPDGRFLLQWGGHGLAPGEFMRPQSLALDEQGRLWVADSCNHRIQIFDAQGKLLQVWGAPGTEPGKLSYPYDIVLVGNDTVYLCEYGNHRVQKFSRDGTSLGCWGGAGRGPGRLFNPWGIVRDPEGRTFVLDSLNHRIQSVYF